MPDKTYLGFTLGKVSMTNTDMVIFQANGRRSKGGDYTGVGHK